MSAVELHYPFRDSQGTLHFFTEGDASERVTLELASAYTRAPSASLWHARPCTGWDTLEGRDDAVRMLVREHCT
jgi:hypothetical protein